MPSDSKKYKDLRSEKHTYKLAIVSKRIEKSLYSIPADCKSAGTIVLLVYIRRHGSCWYISGGTFFLTPRCLGATRDLQNSIGNLMLLEYDINRSIGNLTFKEKKERGNNKLCYKDSRFAVVKKIMKKENWGKEEIEERRKEEIEKISRFIFE